MHVRSPLLTLLAVAFSCASFAQDKAPLPEPGKVTGDWFRSNAYAGDSAVHAYVIHKSAKSTLVDDPRSGYRIVTHHRRVVRVVDKSGLDEATVKIRLWQPRASQDGQSMDELKAFTHTYEDGRLTTMSLDAANVFKTRVDENVVAYAFSLPATREGSVLDLSYREVSDYIARPRPYVMQEDIPVQYAYYEFRTPGRFAYQGFTLGSHPIKYTNESVNNANPVTVMGFVSTGLPALRAQEYITSIDNYRSRVVLELGQYATLDGRVVNMSKTWDDIAKDLREEAGMKEALKGSKYYEEWAAECPAAAADAAERYAWAFDQVTTSFTHDDYISIYARNRGSRNAKESGLNSAEIAAQLVGLSRALGLEAYPVFCSPRSHGYLLEAQPNVASMRHTIVAAKIGAEYVLADPVESNTSPGLLPYEDLNGKGFLVMPKGHEFVDLQERQYAQQQLSGNLTLDEDGYLSGEIKLTLVGQAARRLVERRQGRLGLDLAKADFFDGYALSEVVVTPTRNNAYSVTAQVRSEAPFGKTPDGLIVSPYLGEAWVKNPFDAPERAFPVEFPYKTFENRTITITLPAGYVLESPPAPVRAKTADGAISYSQSIVATDGGLSLQSALAVKQLVYPPEAYPGLREVFKIIAEQEGTLLSVVGE